MDPDDIPKKEPLVAEGRSDWFGRRIEDGAA
jgi:hypothetical protein